MGLGEGEGDAEMAQTLRKRGGIYVNILYCPEIECTKREKREEERYRQREDKRNKKRKSGYCTHVTPAKSKSGGQRGKNKTQFHRILPDRNARSPKRRGKSKKTRTDAGGGRGRLPRMETSRVAAAWWPRSKKRGLDSDRRESRVRGNTYGGDKEDARNRWRDGRGWRDGEMDREIDREIVKRKEETEEIDRIQ